MIVTLFGNLTVAPGMEHEEARLSAELQEAARQHPGFISIKRYRADDGEAVGIIRFSSREALDDWMRHEGHRRAHQADPPIYQSFWIQSAETFREYRVAGPDRVEGDLSDVFASD
jgi:heme-degrading monooxygenase HmoA